MVSRKTKHWWNNFLRGINLPQQLWNCPSATVQGVATLEIVDNGAERDPALLNPQASEKTLYIETLKADETYTGFLSNPSMVIENDTDRTELRTTDTLYKREVERVVDTTSGQGLLHKIWLPCRANDKEASIVSDTKLFSQVKEVQEKNH